MSQGERENQDSRLTLCRCEEVSLLAVRAAIAEGCRTVNDVKRRTRAGMGACQGIYCTRAIALLIQAEAGVPLADLVPMTARPPTRLIPLQLLAAADDE